MYPQPWPFIHRNMPKSPSSQNKSDDSPTKVSREKLGSKFMTLVILDFLYKSSVAGIKFAILIVACSMPHHELRNQPLPSQQPQWPLLNTRHDLRSALQVRRALRFILPQRTSTRPLRNTSRKKIRHPNGSRPASPSAITCLDEKPSVEPRWCQNHSRISQQRPPLEPSPERKAENCHHID